MRVLQWVKHLTFDQWEALFEQYPAQQGTPRERLAVLGLFVVACCVLIFNDDFAVHMWRYVPGFDWAPKSKEWFFWRRVGWALWIAIAYTIPMGLYCRFALGLRGKDLGLDPRQAAKHAHLYLFLFALVMPFVAWQSMNPHFDRMYPMAKGAGYHLEYLAAWESAYGIQFVGVEFFWRGALLFGTVRFFGPWAIPMMMIPYCMLHFGKPTMEAIGSIFAGLALGIVALRTRSIYGGIAIHASVAWSMDLLVLWNSGKLARLFGLCFGLFFSQLGRVLWL